MTNGSESKALQTPRHNPNRVLSTFAQDTIAKLGLEPHPEGGWFMRDWQSTQNVSRETATAWPSVEEPTAGEGHDLPARPLASLIYFLLPAGDYSEWHTVDAEEIWLWHGPGPVILEYGGSGETPVPDHRITLGVDAENATGHAVVPAHVWQRTLPTQSDALVSCVVSPGFEFAGFTLDTANQPQQ